MNITVTHLQKSYPKVEVLKDVTFSVPSGQVFGLLGPNGAGKSTIVKILATLLKPDGGTATIGEYDVLKSPARVREAISLTGQYAAVDEQLTARENMMMVGKLFHLKDPKARANALLAQLRLTDAADRRVSGFSGGMKRRLDIAMSLIGDPRVIFLDEPTTGLDPQSRLELWGLIRELKGQGVTIFLTTQYLDEAEQLADQIAVLHRGEIIASGTLAQLKKLLPSGRVQFGFSSRQELDQATSLLADYQPQADGETLTLSVQAGEDVAVLADILQTFKQHALSPAFFKQLDVSLEDIFLSLVQK